MLETSTRNLFVASTITAFVAVACGEPSPGVRKAEAAAAPLAAPAAPAGSTCAAPLRVLLFPYIPACADDDGFLAMRRRMEDEFYARTGRCASVTIADPGGKTLYKPETAARLFKEGPLQFDVVELDTAILGDVAAHGVLAPWPGDLDAAQWWPAAREAATLDGQLYGVPHLLCGEFLLTRDAGVLAATGGDELKAALAMARPAAPRLIGDAAGSFTVPGLYLDSLLDSNPGVDLAAAMDPGKFDAASAGPLARVLGECVRDGENLCLTEGGKYDDNVVAARELGEGAATAIFGYSERLHYALRAAKDPEAIHLTPAPFGAGKNLLLYSDALVLRRECEDACRESAIAFAEYLNADTTMKWYLLAEECGEAVPPRYLIPATRSAFDIPEIERDRHYKAIRPAIEQGVPLPNRGFYERRKELQKKLLEALKPTK